MATSPYILTGTNIPFWVLFGWFVLGEFAMQLRSRLNKTGTTTERWTVPMVNVCVVAGLLVGFGLTYWHRADFAVAARPLFAVGLALMAVGIFVRQWSMVALGRFFTADVRVHPDQTVVEGGPYRWVRHPSYAGLVVFDLGLGLALGNWATLAALLVLPTIGLVVRIRSEEHDLKAQLGDDYRRFADSRRRLLPGLW